MFQTTNQIKDWLVETFCRFRFQNVILIISLPDTTIKYWGCSARIVAFVNSDNNNIYIYIINAGFRSLSYIEVKEEIHKQLGDRSRRREEELVS
jgi:hypothetical protein